MSTPAPSPKPAFVAVVGQPRNILAGRYLEGPRDAKQVRRDGYAFTADPFKAWPFRSEKQAAAKCRVVERHMGWGEGVMVTSPQANQVPPRV